MSKVPLTPAMKHILTSEPKDLEEALDNAQALIDEAPNSQKSINTIRTYSFDIDSFKQRLTTLKEELQEIIEATSEYEEVVRLDAEFKAAKENLKRVLTGKQEYVDLLENIAEEKEAKKGAESILSDYLVAYFAQTGERQVELNAKDAREVIVSGKLGKQQKFQTSLFKKEQS